MAPTFDLKDLTALETQTATLDNEELKALIRQLKAENRKADLKKYKVEQGNTHLQQVHPAIVKGGEFWRKWRFLQQMEAFAAEQQATFDEAIKARSAKLKEGLDALKAAGKAAEDEMRAQLAGLAEEKKQKSGWKEIGESL
ncbi:hypothetical protein CC86DRAFT_468228 [Ophiobolus disseminans]|uniref:Uncharacterized protein n=1 Tax=Ophiobolus disseminans TaxID=1469910 RepID=A0A6A6ZWU4_9PLEO|nr:hypothetical protein CC86DRAFT_468228 [Ophiobolus disseminans]